MGCTYWRNAKDWPSFPYFLSPTCQICSLQHVRNVPQNGTGASRHGFSWWVVCGVYPWCFLLKSYLFLSIRIDWNRFPIQKLAYSKFILFSAVVCIPHTVTESFLASQIFDWRFVKVNVLKWKQRWKLNIHAELERLYRPSISFLLFKYACDTVVLISVVNGQSFCLRKKGCPIDKYDMGSLVPYLVSQETYMNRYIMRHGVIQICKAATIYTEPIWQSCILHMPASLDSWETTEQRYGKPFSNTNIF